MRSNWRILRQPWLQFRRIGCGLLVALSAGCSDVDWNWDTTWWDPPKRTVRPIRPTQPGDSQRDFAYAPKTTGQYSAPPAGSGNFQNESLTSANAGASAGTDLAPPSHDPEPPVTHAPPQPSLAVNVAAQAFYQLYLASSQASEQPVPGTARVILSAAGPRSVASALEVLYPPMGRSGSDVESYLIYEQREEFDAARAMVSALDVASGGGGVFETAVGMYYAILAQDASVNRELVKSCQAKLGEAQAAGGDRLRKWAAAILKGRLATEFTYDYPQAIAAFDDAARIAGPGTLEDMVAKWWAADALRMEGGRAKAKRHLEDIVQTYSKYPQSQIVRRAKAAL